MKRLLAFLWDFVVGDDWRVAAGVAVAIGLTAILAGTSIPAWWVLPLAVAALLGYSVWRAAVAASRGGAAQRVNSSRAPDWRPSDR